ncbi:MAG: 1-(5-phosphoribosyl)-5-[(5-phosphoribosylamino)methylideneamino] imidazole-4-carboxamide isomerase [Planctomycetaceae bacterium]|nr:1-(5-phosphoribosyl)-5-[(5-phosphoribosylamino)methylideneamino] imidazole-4-carboxamide isomerase [Planctomycetaceae bacterium]
MIIFPAMDLYNGDIVKLEAKQHKAVEIVYGKPAEIAARWLGLGAEWLHVVDLNAALGDGTNLPALHLIQARAQKTGARIQWGGGVRDDAAVKAVLDAGAERAIVGTKAIRDWAWLVEAAARHPGRIMVSIDGKGREIMVNGWQASAGVDAVEFIARANALPLAGYLYTNVAVEGRGQGVDWTPIRDIVETSTKPVVFSGGVTTIEDVARFKELGAYGIIAGSALYKGRIDFTQAKALAT